MRTNSLFGLLILFGTALLISAVSAGVIFLILKFKKKKEKENYNINLGKFYFQVWLIIIESAVIFFIFRQFLSFLLWCITMFITTILSLKYLRTHYVINPVIAKKKSRRIELEKQELIKKEDFIIHTKHIFLKIIFFSFALFFVPRIFNLIPFLKINDNYNFLLTYFQVVLLIISISVFIVLILHIIDAYVGWWPSRVDWFDNKIYRIIWYCSYIGFTLVALIIMTLGYFGIWK